jgi:hypothetical protein
MKALGATTGEGQSCDGEALLSGDHPVMAFFRSPGKGRKPLFPFVPAVLWFFRLPAC